MDCHSAMLCLGADPERKLDRPVVEAAESEVGGDDDSGDDIEQRAASTRIYVSQRARCVQARDQKE